MRTPRIQDIRGQFTAACIDADRKQQRATGTAEERESWTALQNTGLKDSDIDNLSASVIDPNSDRVPIVQDIARSPEELVDLLDLQRRKDQEVGWE